MAMPSSGGSTDPLLTAGAASAPMPGLPAVPAHHAAAQLPDPWGTPQPQVRPRPLSPPGFSSSTLSTDAAVILQFHPVPDPPSFPSWKTEVLLALTAATPDPILVGQWRTSMTDESVSLDDLGHSNGLDRLDAALASACPEHFELG